MANITVHFPDGVYAALVEHLLPAQASSEEAAFGFAIPREAENTVLLELVEILHVPPEGFEERSLWYLHLSDETRANVIKRAHDLKASLIEFHSHPGQERAEFSPSDCSGFGEFVPHVSWRLKEKPYAAFVFGQDDFDALAWHKDPHAPQQLKHVTADGQLYFPTGLTLLNSNSRRHHEH